MSEKIDNDRIPVHELLPEVGLIEFKNAFENGEDVKEFIEWAFNDKIYYMFGRKVKDDYFVCSLTQMHKADIIDIEACSEWIRVYYYEEDAFNRFKSYISQFKYLKED